jgi:hypothetical protein
MKDRVAEKMRQTRGSFSPLANASIPEEKVISRRDPWVGRLTITSIAAAILAIALFVSYKIILQSPISTLGGK